MKSVHRTTHLPMFPQLFEGQIKLDSSWITIPHMFTHWLACLVVFTSRITSETWAIFQTKSKDAAEKDKYYKNINVGLGRPENIATPQRSFCSTQTLY